MVIDPANHDDNTNEDDFLEMEKEILGRYGDDVLGTTPGPLIEAGTLKFGQSFGQGQIQTILKCWFPILRKKVEEEASDGINHKYTYETELLKVESLITDFKSALSYYHSYGSHVSDKKEKEKLEEYEENTKGMLWSVPWDFDLLNRPDEWRQPSPINRPDLESAVAEYLKKGWLQINIIDWTVINALLFDETVGMIDGIRSGRLFGKLRWPYYLARDDTILARSDNQKLWLAEIKLALLAFISRWILPPAVISGLLYYTEYPGSAIAVVGLWSLYLLYRLITIPHRRRESRKAEKKMEKYQDIVEALITAWQFANTEVINPTRLKEFVVAAEDKGAMLSPVVHSLLDRAIQRDPAVFIISGN